MEQSFQNLAQEARELYLDSAVPYLDKTPTPLQFYREYVAPNKPVILSDFTEKWPALSIWNQEYFRKTIGDETVTVAVTPNGYADAVNSGYFLMPEERQMTMADFLDTLSPSESTHNVFYIQKQNSNLTEEFKTIMCDVDTQPVWGAEVFGKHPDAVNLWIGDGRAVTSMHRDHYENLYCVISGWKTFILIPPTDLPFVPYERYPAARYKQVNGKFVIEPDNKIGQTEMAERIPSFSNNEIVPILANLGSGLDPEFLCFWSTVMSYDPSLVPWIAIDPLKPDLDQFPQYARCQPLEVTVHAGETLYLPSLWFHHVRQSHGCIAVNLWYDMEFDIKYAYYKFLENVANLARNCAQCEPPPVT